MDLNQTMWSRMKHWKGMRNILIIFVVFLLTAGLGGYLYIHRIMNQTNQVDVDKNNLAASDNHDSIINIALFGIDSASGEGRSDAIMIVTLDKNRGKVKLTSIMRDSYVAIDGHGMDKINHAYAFGGPELAIKTLNQNFGLNITDFASVDFDSMPKIIDQLGGVEITLTQEEVNTGSISGVTVAGSQTLNGEQALAYSRIRYATGNDYTRTERQRTVLMALASKVVKQPITSYPQLLSQLASYTTTSLSADAIINLATVYGNDAKHGIQEERFPLDADAQGQMIDGVYYLVYDLPTEKQKIDDFIYYDQMPSS